MARTEARKFIYLTTRHDEDTVTTIQYSCPSLLPDGELEGVDLAEPLLVGQGGDVLAETLEGVVDALHPPPLPHVGSVPHVHLARDLLLPALSHLESDSFFTFTLELSF